MFARYAAYLLLDVAAVDTRHPHQIGSIPRMLKTIGELEVSDAVKKKIYSGNAAVLLGLR